MRVVDEKARKGNFHTSPTMALLLAMPLIPASAFAQADDRWADFDIDRLWSVDSTIFVPFHVTETRPLVDALNDGTVDDDTPMLILERNGGVLSLVTTQAAYHHIIQGEMNGEPWMVSF